MNFPPERIQFGFSITPLWINIKQKIKSEFDFEVWKQWLSGLEVFSIEDSKIVLSAPSKFIRDWIIREMLDDIKVIIRSLYPDLKTVSIFYAVDNS